MIYTIALTQEERDRIVKNLSDEARTGDTMDRQVLEAFVRGSIDNTESKENFWAHQSIETRYARYKEER